MTEFGGMRMSGGDGIKREGDDTVAALGRVEHVSNFDRHGSKAALVVSLEFALIKYLN
jgi:hypothetical protein